jgi:hypothetical protein
MHDRELFIDGRWRAARQGRRTTITDPATGEPVGSTAIADAKDIDDAVAAAKRALPLWAGTHADERARILHRAADLIVERLDAIADLLTHEQGKPIPDAVKEIRFAVEVIRYYAEEGRRIGGSIRASVRDYSLELSGRHLCMEGRASAGRRLHHGRQTSAGDAARHCACRSMYRRRRLTRGGVERPSGVRPGGGRSIGCASGCPHDYCNRFDRRGKINHAGGFRHAEAPISRTRRTMSVRCLG